MKRTSERIEAAARKLGYSVESQHASTGSIYLTCTRPGYDVTVRVADHAEAYTPSRNERRLCVSPVEMTADAAIAALADPASIEPYRPAVEHDAATAAYVTEQKRRDAEYRDRAKAEAAKLSAADRAAMESAGMNRRRVHEICNAAGLNARLVYMGLTGRKM